MAAFIIFGAGKIGRRIVETLRIIGMHPLAVIDNDHNLWGNELYNVPIASPDSISKLKYDYILIAIKNNDEIRNQLRDLNVSDDKIICVSSVLQLLESNFIRILNNTNSNSNCICREKTSEKVLFDMSNGMAMGGVESWSVNSSLLLNKRGKKCFLIVNGDKPAEMSDCGISKIEYNNQENFCDYINNILLIFVSEKPCALVCNFVSYFLWAAVLAKMAFPSEIDLIVTQHSDDMTYYNGYGKYMDCIDSYLYVSNRIGSLLEKNNANCKYKKVIWEIESAGKRCRSCADADEELRVGYAGRITKTAKRCDLLLAIIRRTKERSEKIHFYIAGDGDYSAEMIHEIRRYNLNESVDMIGAIPHDKIMNFWEDKDVYISCSEYEGHSISQCEAMAAGAVPVVTNVSGVEDDIIDGADGFVVDIGDVDMLVDSLLKLQCDRAMLENMGNCARKTIEEKYSREAAVKFWEEVL